MTGSECIDVILCPDGVGHNEGGAVECQRVVIHQKTVIPHLSAAQYHGACDISTVGMTCLSGALREPSNDMECESAAHAVDVQVWNDLR